MRAGSDPGAHAAELTLRAGAEGTDVLHLPATSAQVDVLLDRGYNLGKGPASERGMEYARAPVETCDHCRKQVYL